MSKGFLTKRRRVGYIHVAVLIKSELPLINVNKAYKHIITIILPLDMDTLTISSFCTQFPVYKFDPNIVPLNMNIHHEF